MEPKAVIACEESNYSQGDNFLLYKKLLKAKYPKTNIIKREDMLSFE